METFTFRGVAVHYRKMKASRILAHPFGSRTHPAVCALLERDIVEGEEVYLLLSNWKLFDNCWAVAAGPLLLSLNALESRSPLRRSLPSRRFFPITTHSLPRFGKSSATTRTPFRPKWHQKLVE